MSYEDGTELQRRDKGKFTTTQGEGSTVPLEERKMIEKQLEELQRSEKQRAEDKIKLLEGHIRILEKQLEELKRMLEKQHDEANTKLSEEYKKGLEKQNDRIIGFQTTAFQFTNWYFVSQAVVFSPLAGDSSSMSCQDVWLPLVLSLVPAIFILCELGLIRNEYRKAIKYRDESSSEYERLVRKMLDKKARNTNEPLIALDFKQKSWDAIFFDACMFVFSIVALVIAFGSYWRLCRRS